MSKFPRHIDYFNIVFLLGGTIGNISCARTVGAGRDPSPHRQPPPCPALR
eukprot:SAG11_NODE_35901_length_264_cov_0.939394_1_plen_49_part_01